MENRNHNLAMRTDKGYVFGGFFFFAFRQGLL